MSSKLLEAERKKLKITPGTPEDLQLTYPLSMDFRRRCRSEIILDINKPEENHFLKK
ncbi:MAG: hypothetical protein PHW72_01425 [Candidatus Pacebacteria bacterium]|nr:hypothetical protein [Candidatus Paceibacterota bacterium]